MRPYYYYISARSRQQHAMFTQLFSPFLLKKFSKKKIIWFDYPTATITTALIVDNEREEEDSIVKSVQKQEGWDKQWLMREKHRDFNLDSGPEKIKTTKRLFFFFFED